MDCLKLDRRDGRKVRGFSESPRAAKRRDHLCCLGIDLGQHVGVDIQGEGHSGVPQAPRDDRRIDALGQGDTRVGVAQPVERDRRQRRGAHETAKRALMRSGWSCSPLAFVKTRPLSTHPSPSGLLFGKLRGGQLAQHRHRLCI